MEGDTRRKQLLKLITNSQKPLSGTVLAKRLGISRQVIVQDIAVLRAGNHAIYATNRGYLLHKEPSCFSRVVYVKHTAEQIEEELNTIVDCGASVIDVIVQHGVYGTIKTDLYVSSRQEVQLFLKQMKQKRTKPLTDLTGGVHGHTIQAKSVEILNLVEKLLNERGFLYVNPLKS